jgi:hypothetical protein
MHLKRTSSQRRSSTSLRCSTSAACRLHRCADFLAFSSAACKINHIDSDARMQGPAVDVSSIAGSHQAMHVHHEL